MGFKQTVRREGYHLSDQPGDILPFDNFLETDIAQGKIFRGKRTAIIHNWTMTIDPDYKYVEAFKGIQWHMMDTKDYFKYQF